MRFLPPILLALYLGGCATAPEPRIITKEVLVPVVKACVPADLAPKPASYADDGLNSATAPDERYLATARANQERKARLARVEPVLESCR